MEARGESRGAVLGQGVVYGVLEKARGDSTDAVLGQSVHACCCWVWCRWPDNAENCGDAADAVLEPGGVYARFGGTIGADGQGSAENCSGAAGAADVYGGGYGVWAVMKGFFGVSRHFFGLLLTELSPSSQLLLSVCVDRHIHLNAVSKQQPIVKAVVQYLAGPREKGSC